MFWRGLNPGIVSCESVFVGRSIEIHRVFFGLLLSIFLIMVKQWRMALERSKPNGVCYVPALCPIPLLLLVVVVVVVMVVSLLKPY